MIITIIGWTAIITSWLIPHLMNNKQKARLIGIALSAFACGLFSASILIKLFGL